VVEIPHSDGDRYSDFLLLLFLLLSIFILLVLLVGGLILIILITLTALFRGAGRCTMPRRPSPSSLAIFRPGVRASA
jgi:hypothetical protein